MIQWAEEYALEKWSTWTGRNPRGLRCAAIFAARHGNGRCAMLISDGLRRPEVAVKLGWSTEDSGRITAEYSALRDAGSQLPAKYALELPTAFELVSTPGGIALFSRALPGKHPLFPHLLGHGDHWARRALDRYLESTLSWTYGLASSTRVTWANNSDPAANYHELFPDQTAARHLVGRTPPGRAWQHGDPAIGNALLERDTVRFIDWEHASSKRLPWHDMAYVVLVLALIAARQSAVDPREAFSALYRQGSWCGDMIRRRVTEIWNHPVDLSVGVALTSMQLAVERSVVNDAWLVLAEHLLSRKGPEWLWV